MPVAYRAVALGFGYVESHSTSWLIYTAELKSPTTRKEALTSLAKHLYANFMANGRDSDNYRNMYTKSHMAACCQRAWALRDRKNEPTKCPTCEARYDVVVKTEFDVEDWLQFLRDIDNSDCDSYGGDEDNDNIYGWSPFMFDFNVPQNQMVIVHENAEHILTDALFDAMPDLKPKDHYHSAYISEDYDQICNESLVYHSYSYVDPKNTRYLSFKETITHDYDNGGQSVMVNGIYTYIKYNTGDQIWLEYKDGKYKVVRALTHDGIEMKA